jgi:hypothetical protein
MVKNTHWSSRKVLVISMKFEIETDFRKKNPRISNYMKLSPVGAELFHADRRVDMTKLVVAFGNFANASGKSSQ